MKHDYHFTLTRSLWVLLSLVGLAASASGASLGGKDDPPTSHYTLDLAAVASQKRTIVPNQKFDLTIKNKIPGQDYSIDIQRSAVSINAFELPSGLKQQADAAREGANKAGLAIEDDGACKQLLADARGLYAISQEGQLPEYVRAVEAELANLNGKCTPSSLASAQAIVDLTRLKLEESYTLKPGELLTVVITRDTGSGKRTWSYTFTTEARGEWQISYGFSFITQWLDREKLYSTAPYNNEFIIRQDRRRQHLSFAPSIFFTWLPAKDRLTGPSWGFSGGLGFESLTPTVFISPTLSINQNLKLHAGVVAHRQLVLRGTYQVNQVVGENLTREQLHETGYAFNPFFSLSLRLTENPFNRAQPQPSN